MLPTNIKKIADELRLSVLSMAKGNGGAHLAGPLSIADLYATLYFGDIVQFGRSNDATRTRVVLSAGHYVPIHYAVLVKLGIISSDSLFTLGKLGGLPVHPEYSSSGANVPGIEISAGPLAQGMSVAVGMAIGMLKKRIRSKIYCICSDGELQEGQAWEAISLAVREKLSNIVFLIDNNNVQIGSYVTQIAGETRIESKLEAFGCHTLVVDGHDHQKIHDVIVRSASLSGAPTAIVLKTIGGKGVSFMENNPKWHDGKISDEQFEVAKRELLK